MKAHLSTATLLSVLAVGLTLLSLPLATLALKEGDCEVCVSVLNRFRETLDKEEATKPEKIEKKFKEYCKDLKLRENRFVSLDFVTALRHF